MERRRIVLFLLLFLGLPGILSANDPPHNEASGVGCADCHGQSLLNSQSPFYTDNRSDTAYNAICTGVCHNADPVGYDTGNEYTGSLAPMVQSHTPGGTPIKCTVCHHNHDQDQIYTGKNEKNNFFIATGTVDTEAPTPIAYDSGTNKTTITFATLTATDGSSQWADLSLLAKKTGDGRGAMLVPNHTSRKRWPVYIIKSLDTTAGIQTITVKGQVTSASNLGIFYGQSIRRSINYDSVPGMPRSIKLYDRTGANGFADNDTPGGDDKTPNGICQVCHTTTDHWRNDGTLSAIGVHAGMDDGVNCSNCHGHTDGFKPSCDTCHGYAPDPLVSNPGPTGSITAGVHTEHTTNQGYGCEVCHYDSVGSGSTHNNGDLKVTMGFAPPNGIPQGGSYDGQTTAQYDAATTTPPTTVTNTGSKTCSNLYCHGDFAGSGNNATPVWDDAATGDCNTCHGSNSGAHSDHTSIHGFDCSLCHYDTADGSAVAADTTAHVNYATDWRFDPTDNRTSTAIYNTSSNGSKSPPSTTYESCGNLYCHSSVQGGADPTDPPAYQNPSWSSSMAGCDDCHKAGAHREPPFMDSGSHYAHVQYRLTQPGNCQACHYLDKGGSLCEACHSPHGFIMSRRDNHVDGNIDVDFLTTIAGSGALYNGDSVPRTAYSSCENIYCHSVGDTSVSTGQLPAAYSGSIYTQPTWGGSSLGCNGCHGRNTTDGMPDYTNGGTGAEDANSHPQHVADNEVGCQECHYDTTTDGTTIADKAIHVDGVNTDVVFNAVNNLDGVYNAPAGKTCDNTYCHSDGTTVSTGYYVHEVPVNTSPDWDGSTPDPQADGFACNNCHAYGPDYDLYDPKANSHVRHDFLGCESCHYSTTTDGSTISDYANHINLQYDIPPPPPVPEYYPEATIVSGRTVDVTVTTTDDFGVIYVYFNGSTQTISPSDPDYSVQYTYPSAGTREIRVLVYDPGHIQYDYYWDDWPVTQDCSTCPTLKIPVP